MLNDYKKYLKDIMNYLADDLEAGKDPTADFDFADMLVQDFHDKTSADKLGKIKNAYNQAVDNPNRSEEKAGQLTDKLFNTNDTVMNETR